MLYMIQFGIKFIHCVRSWMDLASSFNSTRIIVCYNSIYFLYIDNIKYNKNNLAAILNTKVQRIFKNICGFACHENVK